MTKLNKKAFEPIDKEERELMKSLEGDEAVVSSSSGDNCDQQEEKK